MNRSQAAKKLRSDIESDPAAKRKVFKFLKNEGHTVTAITDETMALLCGVKVRSWYRWTAGERQFPEQHERSVRFIAGLK
jgi:hypothetical protein